MAERGLRLLISFFCLTCLCSTAVARQADKGSALRRFTPFGFWTEPADTLAVRGAPALLNCSVQADAPVRLQWRKDGTFLNLASAERRQLLPDGSLLIGSVLHSKHNKPDEGLYQCVATIDSLGTIGSRYARLTVASLPRFSSQPEAASVRQGDSEVMNCEVTPDLVTFTHWERNGQPVELDDRIVQLPSAALVISNASEADAGLYRCVVENMGPGKTSDEAELKVLPETEVDRKLEFLRKPVPVTKVAGDNILIPCVVTGFPVPSVRWILGDERVDESVGRFKVVGGGSLQILNLTAEDAGIYSCMAENGNETIEAQAELTVQVPPRFLKRPANMYAHESMDVVFECEVTGTPPPTIQWVKNGDAVIPSDYFRIIREQYLQVQGLVKSDEGFYQCVAQNEAGNVQASAQLIVLDHGSHGNAGPTPSAPRDVVASLVSTRFVKLTWRPPAEPHGDNITYTVYYSQEDTNRERVMNTSRPGELQVTIQNLQPDTKYLFRVVALNWNGPGESSVTLPVSTQAEVQVPGPAPHLQAVSSSPTSVSLSWETPLTGNGDILSYKLYYMEKGLGNEQDLDVAGLSYTLTGLKKFTEYSFRVVAYNKHGPGVSTEDVGVRTLSDVPSAAPQNLTLEVQDSKSIMVRWLPPPPGTHNGEIIGYKIRYRRSVRKSEVAEITVGPQLFHLVDGLERGAEYTFRVTAATVNGSGPASDWVTAETFESDLDETRVPDVPSSLHVRPLVNSIVVSWTPPQNQDIVVRGYTIGYGIGSPHAQTVKVDYKQRYYSIDNLDPSSHYVITLKAFNNMGEGIPLYESAVTRPQSDPIDPDVDLYELFHVPYTPAPDPSPMLPPVGVQASVLSHDTIKVTWADNSLPKNQRITDTRYYTVRWKTNIPANTKVKTANTTSLSHMVTGLKPNTLYEFSVMVTKGRRASTWSMTAQGTTFESIPSTAPKDVTVVSKEGRPRTIIINWQPPLEANGKITGYIIYYSTDVNAEVHDWVIEPVVGNRLTHQIQDLTLDTSYYFKIQARNSKGMGPMSEPVHFRTPKAEPSDKMANDQASGTPVRPGARPPAVDHGVGSPVGKPGVTGTSDSHILIIVIIVSVGVFTIVVLVLGAFLCTRRTSSQQKKKRAASKSATSSHKYKSSCKDLKPPDLWIHHERMELKRLEKSPEPNPTVTDTPIAHTSQDITPIDAAGDNPTHQRRNSYRGHESEDSLSVLTGRQGSRPKITMPFDAQPPQPVVSAHPIHSLHNHHHQPPPGSLAPLTGSLHYQLPPPAPLPHKHDSTESVRSPPSKDPPAASAPTSSATDGPEPEGHTHGPAPSEEPGYNPPTAHVRPTHPLKSFGMPATPAHNPAFDSPALPTTSLLPQPGPSSQLHGVKTAPVSTLARTRAPMPVIVPSSSRPDELTEEMAHLEGLMKDLNVITN
ncbi:neogenin-like [Megalops cyprinoides]|uniref:neogenin-like n=1 Tax=Megalops cyprinoides TaxID=118141 RepID=UPI001864B459|nr:neogenin-like [Megalops cyprinoides]